MEDLPEEFASSFGGSIEWVPDVSGIFGSFEVQQNRLPYLNTVFSADQCARHLDLVSRTPQFTLEAGDVQSLFQRDVDLARTHQMASKYLVNDKSPPFFNSITIALIPDTSCSEQKHTASAWSSESSQGVHLTWQNSTAEGYPRKGLASLSWVKNKVSAVAIDGQHRLKALKTIAETNSSAAESIQVPVIFLLLDPAFGLRANDEGLVDEPIRLLRRLFIDLNKHAKPVDRTRQLLLDERDVYSVAVQGTVSSELSFEESGEHTPGGLPIGSDGEFRSKLPLALVDWHSGSAKVDTGPHLVSVLGLEWIIDCLKDGLGGAIDLKKIISQAEKLRDEKDKNYYEALRAKLSHLSDDRYGLFKAIEVAEDQQAEFQPPASAYAEIGSDIVREYAGPITHLLTAFPAYERLCQIALSANAISTSFVTWYQKKIRSESYKDFASRNDASRDLAAIEQEFVNHGRHDELNGYKAAIDPADSGSIAATKMVRETSHLFYSQTGQRAFVMGYKFFSQQIRDSDVEQFSQQFDLSQDFYSSTALLKAAVYCAALSKFDIAGEGTFFTSLSRCDDGSALPQEFWRGSLLRREIDNMEFSDSAAKRAARVMNALAAISICHEFDSGIDLDTIRVAVDGETPPIEGGPLLQSAVSKAVMLNTYSDEREYGSPFHFLVLYLDETEWPDLEGYKDICSKRLFWALKQL